MNRRGYVSNKIIVGKWNIKKILIQNETREEGKGHSTGGKIGSQQ